MRKIDITYNDAVSAYEKFLKEGRGLFGLSLSFRDKEELESFSEKQKEHSAYNSVYLGIKNVPVDNIKGSVQKYMDFDRDFIPKNNVIEDRWCRVYMAYMNEDPLAPIELYKVKNDYFVYDGNHRVSVAKFLNFAVIEAEVTEFITSDDDKESVIYREKFIFEKTTGIESIIFTETSQYNRITKEISEYRDYLYKKERRNVDFYEASNIWFDNIYLPAVRIMESSGILENFKERTIADLFVYFLDHKYFASEKEGKDIGFTYALIDFINRFKEEEVTLEMTLEVDESMSENLKILLEVDKKKYLDPEIIRKNEILKEITHLEFNHNFIILFEIDDYLYENNIYDFREGARKWYEEVFARRIMDFRSRISGLPEQYSKYLSLFMKSREKLFFSVYNFSNTYEIGLSWKPSYMETLAYYILDIYIPIIENLTKRDVKENDFLDDYYGIQGKFNYLKEFKEGLTIDEAADSYFMEDRRKYQKIHDWFLLKFNNTPKSEILIDYVLGKFELKVKDKTLFRKILEKYGKPQKYGSIFKLEKAKEDYEKIHPENDWIKDKMSYDVEKMAMSKDIVAFFKTKNLIENLKGDDTSANIIDFYSDVISYGRFLGKDLNEIDIIDLWIEYKKIEDR